MLDINKSLKKRTNLSINNGLLQEAKALKINLSKAAEAGIYQAILEAKKDSWLAQNQTALKSSNIFVEQQGLPLDQHRHF